MSTKLMLTITCLSAAALLPVAAGAEEQRMATLLPPPVESAFRAEQNAPATTTVVVLKEAVQKGQTIVAENVTTQTIPASQAFASTITNAEELVGQQAIRPLMAGVPINRLHVRVAPNVARNQAVTLVFKRGGVELTGRGQALEDGALGQSIRVMNPATRTTIVGVVAEGGIVEVN